MNDQIFVSIVRLSFLMHIIVPLTIYFYLRYNVAHSTEDWHMFLDDILLRNEFIYYTRISKSK
jgi:hypothetical protein